MNYRIKLNQWDNWNGYEGVKKVKEFGTNEQAAREWLQEKRCNDLVSYSADIDPLIYNDTTHDFQKEHWVTLAMAALDQAGLTKLESDRIQERIEELLDLKQD